MAIGCTTNLAAGQPLPTIKYTDEARVHKNGLLLELHALTQVARSYVLLDEVIMWLFDFSLALCKADLTPVVVAAGLE